MAWCKNGKKKLASRSQRLKGQPFLWIMIGVRLGCICWIISDILVGIGPLFFVGAAYKNAFCIVRELMIYISHWIQKMNPIFLRHNVHASLFSFFLQY